MTRSHYVTFSILHVLVVVVVSVTAAKQCSSVKDTCVPIKFCPRIYDAIMSSEVYRNATLHRDIRARACFDPDHDEEQRVCCEPADLSLGKQCSNSLNITGRCVQAEHCKPIANYLRRGRRSTVIEKELRDSLCYQDGSKDYYCCPEGSIMETPTKKQRTKNTHMMVDNDFPTCRDAVGKPGLCVPVQHCDRIHNAFLDSTIRQDGKLAEFVNASRCQADARDSTAICCAKRSGGTKSATFIRHAKAAKLGLNNCGTVRIFDKILKGNEAALGQYPWMANLMYSWKGTIRSLCSGSLIHPRYVLTAAHCMKGSTRPKAVRLGEYDLAHNPDCSGNVCAQPVKEYEIEKLIPNENFNGFNADYDIALVRLASSVALSVDQIYPICLPLTENLLMLKPNKLTVTGWGLTEKQELSSVLLEADLRITKRMSLCEGERTFCTRGKELEGHCRGDSGGPYQTMVATGDSYKYVLFGIISGGSGQCSVKDKLPGVGVMVGFHLYWILDHMDI
ncbi:serine protease grass-like [Topomyia yanbarensis]|uniref:serine protease grass-like n=1 Tax=Topomyia yanbarensis TaxID=2498891 RepID=UPI00273B4CB6|nr:serine protease grass-like [Topomyia yanbarensis]